MTRRLAVGRDDVPYLPKHHIEREAELLLTECAETIGVISEPPIPIDDILEIHLKLTIEYKNMRELFPFGDVHGAIWMSDCIVGADMGLDPHVNPKKRGRYHFTLAHEAGHWRLHRKYYLEDMNQGWLFGDDLKKPGYVCLSSEKKKPVEWQADQFAANVLMPRQLVIQAWQDRHGNLDPIYLDDLQEVRKQILTADVLRRGVSKAGDTTADDMVFEHVSRPLAEWFQVSAEAMRIRLEELGLLLRNKEALLFD